MNRNILSLFVLIPLFQACSFPLGHTDSSDSTAAINIISIILFFVLAILFARSKNNTNSSAADSSDSNKVENHEKEEATKTVSNLNSEVRGPNIILLLVIGLICIFIATLAYLSHRI